MCLRNVCVCVAKCAGKVRQEKEINETRAAWEKINMEQKIMKVIKRKLNRVEVAEN